MLSSEQLKSMSPEQRKRLLLTLEQTGAEYGVFPLSAEQKRMWFINQANSNDPSYHICFTFEIKGVIDEARIMNTLRFLIERHEVFRTRVVSVDGQPFQVPDLRPDVFHMKSQLMIENHDEDAIHHAVKKERAIAFDLERDFPLRALLLHLSTNHAQLVITIHHIAADGWSIGQFIHEWVETYKLLANGTENELGKFKEEAILQYIDYAVWQKAQFSEGRLRESLVYWKQLLREAPVELHLPLDPDHQGPQTGTGGAEFYLLEEGVCGRLRELARTRRCSLFHVLLSAFYITLFRFTSQSALNVGTAVANRSNDEFKRTIGMFANTIVLHHPIRVECTFNELLDEIKKLVLYAFEHQHVPFDQVIDSLGVERQPGVIPYLQAMFILQNPSLWPLGIETPVELLPDTEVCVRIPGNEIVEYASLPMIMTAVEQGGRIGFRLTYQTDKFSRERMRLFLQHYCGLLEEIGNDASLGITEYQCMSPKTAGKWRRRISTLRYDGPIPLPISEGNLLRARPALRQRYDNGWITVLNPKGDDCLPGFPGQIYISSQTIESWFPTGDLGEWGEDGRLRIHVSRHSNLPFLHPATGTCWTAASLEQAILKLPGMEDSCVDAYPHIDGTQRIVIYYMSAQPKPLRMFSHLLTKPSDNDAANHEWFVCRVRHIPSNAWGVPDVLLLRKQWSDSIEHTLRQRNQLMEHPDCDSVVVLPSTFDPVQAIIPVRDLCDSQEKMNKASENIKHNNGGLHEPSILNGPPLEELQVKTLPELLRHTAVHYPNHHITTIGRNGRIAFSYAELLQSAETGASNLRAAGVKKGERILLFIHELDLWIRIFWSCVLAGAVPVPLGVPKILERNNGGGVAIDKLLQVWSFLGNPRILCDDREALTQYFQARGMVVPELDIVEPNTLLSAPAVMAEPINDRQADECDLAIMLFTSGSTGMPKGVKLSHRNVLKRSQATAEHNRFDSSEVSLNWMPLDHVGGLVMFHLLDVYIGACQIHAETEHILHRPLLWLDYANEYGVTVTWAPNFAFGLIVEQEQEVQQRDWDLSRLWFILNGGEKIQARTASRFMQLLESKMLRQNAMYPSWGMTETSSGVTFSSSFGASNTTHINDYVAVGCPIGGTSLRIVGDDGNPVEVGDIGYLEIKGETITAEYEANEEQNRSNYSKDGWFITGDLARIIDNELVITGRSKETIIVNGINYASAEIENTVEESGYVLPGYVAACSLQIAGESIDRVLLFCTFSGEHEHEAVAAAVRHRVLQKLGLFVDELIPLKTEEFPRTSIGKINRSVLCDRYRQGEYADRTVSRTFGVPSWFYEKQWERRELLYSGEWDEIRTCIIFADEDGLGERIGQRLSNRGITCYDVRPGEVFAQHGSRFILNVRDREHYRQLSHFIREKTEKADLIIYCWSYLSMPDCMEEETYVDLLSLSYLLQEFDAVNDPFRLNVISNGAVRVQENDSVRPAKGSLSGFLRTVPLEMPGMRVKHVDIALGKHDLNEMASSIVSELAEYHYSPEVAYREKNRFIPVLREASMIKEDIDAERGFRHGGIYVVVGGLGEIGRQVAAHLLSIYRAKVMLIGRTDLSNHSEECATEYQNVLNSLSALGDVIYYRADAASREELAEALAHAEARWGRLDAILHLAGEGHRLDWTHANRSMISKMTEATLQDAFRSKVQGARTVLDWAQSRKNVEVIIFSSVNSFLGGSGLAAYSAASSCLDLEVMSRIGQVPCKCVQWSFWDTASNEGAGHATGLSRYALSKWQALVSLEAIMQRNKGSMIVGLNGADNNLCSQYNVEMKKETSLFTLVYSSRSKNPIPTFASEWTADSLVITEFVLDIPYDAQGNVDEQKLATLLYKSKGNVDRPANETERTLIEIWSHILQHRRFQLDDKFFEIGGNSLHTVRVISRINEQFHTHLSITDLFQYPTIRQLAAYLTKELGAGDEERYETEELSGITF
ncbi:SDR family NAD(P)-dependent oxidoreductase [Aneurinibacillus aneurinilyticus]|uniref:SDR family NAD(P)-dependent oxidoreductase n=1 Tax=Aneurinibacillus aneurinilyticus TaxID=1391 RepID=UPI002E1F5DF1|nr:SDR family NAD(P)-dependent oxidoreductase [Aneurinibacillus aneurinilyticus]